MANTYESVVKSATNYEELLRKSNLVFKYYGLTDVNEGTKYLTESLPYRRAYLSMVDDEAYCAFNWYNWLYSTGGGFAARSALNTSSLIFNHEALAYFNPETYLLGDKPGVKKARTLLRDIMLNDDGDDDLLPEVASHASKVGSWSKRLLKVNRATVESANEARLKELDSLADQILGCTSDSQVESLQRKYAELLVDGVKNEQQVLKVDVSALSQALGYGTAVISFADATVEDVIAFGKLESDVQTYLEYRSFLENVRDSQELSPDLRAAAHQLLGELEDGYFNRIMRLGTDVLGLGKGVAEVYLEKGMVEAGLENAGFTGAAGAVGTLAGAVGLLSLGTAISNLLVDTGSFVKEAAYTEGYAELSILYAAKLREDHDAFLSDRSADNAWRFFEDYNMLWKLRYNGERQYLKMNRLKTFIFAEVPIPGYKWKEEVVNDTLARLEECKFEIAGNVVIPESVQYAKKAVFDCPVDVEVIAADGTPIATLRDGKESDVSNEYGRFAVVRDPYSGEYVKVVCLFSEEGVAFKLTATDLGLVSMEYAVAGDGDDAAYAFDNMPVGPGDCIEVGTDDIEEGRSGVKTAVDGGVRSDIPVRVRDGDHRASESMELNRASLELSVGDEGLLEASVSPAAATDKTVSWLSSDESVATVANGKVVALSPGSAVVTCFSLDNVDVCAECAITVSAAEDEHTHSLAAVEEVPATCTEGGVAAHWECSGCGKLFSDAEGTVEATADDLAIPALGHSWDGGAATEAATCTEAGTQTFTCANDASHTRSEAIPATGHSWGAWEVVLAPTVDAAGVRERTCLRCGEAEQGEVAKLDPVEPDVGGNTLDDGSDAASSDDSQGGEAGGADSSDSDGGRESPTGSDSADAVEPASAPQGTVSSADSQDKRPDGGAAAPDSRSGRSGDAAPSSAPRASTAQTGDAADVVPIAVAVLLAAAFVLGLARRRLPGKR